MLSGKHTNLTVTRCENSVVCSVCNTLKYLTDTYSRTVDLDDLGQSSPRARSGTHTLEQCVAGASARGPKPLRLLVVGGEEVRSGQQ